MFVAYTSMGCLTEVAKILYYYKAKLIWAVTGLAVVVVTKKQASVFGSLFLLPWLGQEGHFTRVRAGRVWVATHLSESVHAGDRDTHKDVDAAK